MYIVVFFYIFKVYVTFHVLVFSDAKTNHMNR